MAALPSLAAAMPYRYHVTLGGRAARFTLRTHYSISILSKLKVVCALEAEELLKELTHRRHWVHPIHAERETGEKGSTEESPPQSTQLKNLHPN